MNRLALHADEGMLLHSNGLGHAENSERLRMVVSRLRRAAFPGVVWGKCREAKREELLRVHTPEYVDWLLSQRGLEGRVDDDTRYSSGTVHAALVGAGSSIEAVDSVLRGDVRHAWALVRPPGHHAEPGRAMGFCFLSNAALAARHAMAVYGLKRVMIVDWDVHHGNGTQDAFYDDPSVLFFSSHQAPFFPHTGAARDTGIGAGEGYTVNLPLPGGTNGNDLKHLYRAFVPSLAAAFQPELIIVSAGFDAHQDDPLADFELTAQDFAALTRIVKDVASVVCDDRLVFILEGGYDPRALSDSVLACTQELVDVTHTPTGGRGKISEKVLPIARRFHMGRWPIPEDA